MSSTQTVSFTADQFVVAVINDDNNPQMSARGEAMIDEIIANGLSVVAWMHANINPDMLSQDPEIFYQLAYDEDDEPHPNEFGAPFPRAEFLTHFTTAANALQSALPGSKMDTTPMQNFARSLLLLHEHNIRVRDYLEEVDLITISPMLPYLRLKEDSEKLLGQAIQDDKVVPLLADACIEMMQEEVNNPVPSFHLPPVVKGTLTKRYYNAMLDAKIHSIKSLPEIDVNTIPQDELRCIVCWVDFGEPLDVEPRQPFELDGHHAVGVPCGSAVAHLLHRVCLANVVCTNFLAQCPMCRQPVDIDYAAKKTTMALFALEIRMRQFA